jgi:hypothetical protein
LPPHTSAIPWSAAFEQMLWGDLVVGVAALAVANSRMPAAVVF